MKDRLNHSQTFFKADPIYYRQKKKDKVDSSLWINKNKMILIW
jgi:hypothetical protein